MSLGYGYDMVLLPPRHPLDHDYELSQPGGAVRRYRRSRRARAARRRRARRNYHNRLLAGEGAPDTATPQSAGDAELLIEGLSELCLAAEDVPEGHRDVRSSSSAAPPPGGSGMTPSAAAAVTPRNLLPHGLYNAARAYASSMSTNMSAYEELPGHHLRSALDLVASTPASEYLDSTETPGPELRVIASRRYDSMVRQPHMHPSYYYFGAPDSDSAADCYDLTRECFHIDGAVVSDSEVKAVTAGERMLHLLRMHTQVCKTGPIPRGCPGSSARATLKNADEARRRARAPVLTSADPRARASGSGQPRGSLLEGT